jgi:hypothetical protein
MLPRRTQARAGPNYPAHTERGLQGETTCETHDSGTSGFATPSAQDLVVTVGSNALLSSGAYADPAPEASPGPRIHLPTGPMAKSGRALVLANLATLELVG